MSIAVAVSMSVLSHFLLLVSQFPVFHKVTLSARGKRSSLKTGIPNGDI